ncbi:hypothetical protein Htur_4519 (plasmid) [Haloterrigena turkmenica DSM 5511]|uniref:Uncharacterized protein n=1 Tax=Haloterrigena turkmenica (strain ATCC 51198 / DSM 5511 / JCM 9101 / NCIMB 13204 / VKM B-1734 / 4k) TaxID=543526 RepID=D2S1S9_HALTV|nr:hypothetical protein [Haloterrigena turkmenica]ADB63326.1 hypothetical protein Htur_4519 [Haloterrigena turkmenica DSM 5511]
MAKSIEHGSWATVRSLEEERIRDDPPQLTGEWTADNYVDAYRYYYANGKRHLFGWSKDRSMPPWIPEYTDGPKSNS